MLRRHQTPSHNLPLVYHSYANYNDQEFTVKPNRVAVNETQIQFQHEQRAWLYVAIDVDSKVVLTRDF